MRSTRRAPLVLLTLLCASSSAWAQIKVACAGEHSTQSAFVADDMEYPARLQVLLGDAGWDVQNFGYRRATVQTMGPSLYPQSTPYLQTVEFQNSLAFAPDVVVLGPFGRHDCDMNYTDAGSIDPAGFDQGLRNIVDAYQALPKKPRILIALPIPYMWGNGDAVMSQVVLPITQQVAHDYGLQQIDHWSTYSGRSDLFDPGFTTGDHFNDAGIQLMAVTVMGALLYDGGIDSGVWVHDAGNGDAGGPDAGSPDAGALPATDGQLTPAARGCSSAPGAFVAVAVLLILVRLRRAKARSAALALTLLGCTPSHPPAPPEPSTPGPTIPVQLRRLSNAELNAVTSQLLGHDANLTAGLLQEPRVDGFDDDATTLLVTGPKLDDFVAVAESVAAQTTIPGCSEPGCALDYAANLARRAWGRPMSAGERTRLKAVYDAGGDHQTGVQLMVEAMLLSPNFIYRTELGGPNAKYELASELSFLITGSRPDDELLAAAESDRLFEPGERVSQAQRLMATPQGKLHVRDLLVSWLDLHDMAQVAKLLANFGLFGRPVREQMGTELERFLDDALYGADGTLKGLFTSTRGFPGPLEADYYRDDLQGPIGDFTPVEFDTSRRRGVLSLPGYLAHHAAVDHTAPVQRGLFVRTRLLCGQIAPPPPGAANAPPNPGDTTHTNREKYAAHSADPMCFGCHRLMDPIGFGFENFDTLGRYQTTDNGFPVDASGALTFTDVDGAFTGPAELGLRLGDSAQVRRCFLQNMWQAAAGRQVTLPVGTEVDPSEKMTDVLLEIVRSDGFVRRDASAEGGQ